MIRFVPLLLFLTVQAAGRPAAQPRVDPGDAGADSIPFFVVPDTIRSSTDELTLREIIKRAVEGERTKLAGHRSMTYNASVRTILTYRRKREIRDQLFLAYEDDRGVVKYVELVDSMKRFRREDGDWVLDEGEDEPEVRVEAGDSESRGEDLARVPFFLRNQEDYDFTLEERSLEGDHVIFKIRFRPRTAFKPLPSGTVYVDADNFRVVHEEFTFEQNPVPLIVKNIRRISRQWTELPGGEWVVSKVMGELALQGSWTGVVPERIEVGAVLNDYRFDQPYDERKFGPYGK